MALFRLTSNGKMTIMELDGKTMGMGVEAMSFNHRVNADKDHEVTLHLDLGLSGIGGFKFMEDGRFDEIDAMMREPPMDDDSLVDQTIAVSESMHRVSGSTPAHRKSCDETPQPHNTQVPE